MPNAQPIQVGLPMTIMIIMMLHCIMMILFRVHGLQFCNNGVYRTGFILAAFLVYMGQFESMGAALAFFSRKRLEGHINADVAASAGGAADDEGGDAAAAAAASYDPSMSIFHRMMPTWRFLAGQLDKAFREPASLPKAFRLEHIIIHAPGLKRPSDDNDPVVQILEVRARHCSFRRVYAQTSLANQS